MKTPAPNRLRLDGDALVANWRALRSMGGDAACGAAIKADGYGLGAGEVARRLIAAGCRDLFVATWAEAERLGPVGAAVSVLHGVRPEDMAVARNHPARPVLNTRDQIARWRDTGRPCDVMVDTGMNRLGIAPEDVAAGLLDGLSVETLMSHLASADEDGAMNAYQRARFAAVADRAGARRLSLANSAGIALGQDYAFDLTRPGIALYGGIQRREHDGVIRAVVTPEAQVLQRRLVSAGESVGYGGDWTASRDTPVAILNLGYADGYRRAFTAVGSARAGNAVLPLAGRVSMDLIAVDLSAAPGVREGDWLAIDYDLVAAERATGASQYELLTGLGARFDRVWI